MQVNNGRAEGTDTDVAHENRHKSVRGISVGFLFAKLLNGEGRNGCPKLRQRQDDGDQGSRQQGGERSNAMPVLSSIVVGKPGRRLVRNKGEVDREKCLTVLRALYNNGSFPWSVCDSKQRKRVGPNSHPCSWLFPPPTGTVRGLSEHTFFEPRLGESGVTSTLEKETVSHCNFRSVGHNPQKVREPVWKFLQKNLSG